MDELLVDAEELCRHSFGHHVAQSILEQGCEQHRARVAAALCRDAVGYATHRNASYLVERALCYCSRADQEQLLAQLSQPDTFEDLIMNPYGCFVARALLRDEKMGADAALVRVRARARELEQSRQGQRLLADLGLLSETRAF
eukprot:gb/GFBE01033514.1/.p1 GENE.gb/GFBE01033514.1/~~gb/GFBE01033514.1/.p1  ORF type:complete len:143 (+),score=26.31 gb/GFBE01033514.1/:1-429(+)